MPFPLAALALRSAIGAIGKRILTRPVASGTAVGTIIRRGVTNPFSQSVAGGVIGARLGGGPGMAFVPTGRGMAGVRSGASSTAPLIGRRLKIRRMNPLNLKALMRSIRRLARFRDVSQRVDSSLARVAPSSSGGRRRRHRLGCRCFICKKKS